MKKCFGISGIQSEYDFDVNSNNVATAIDTTKPIEITAKTPIIELKKQIISLAKGNPEGETILTMCKEMSESNQFTEEFANNCITTLKESAQPEENGAGTGA